MTQTIVVAAASCVGALLAGILGAWLALRRYRQERSFDARIEWHRNLAETAKKLSNRNKSLRYGFTHETAAEAMPDVEEVVRLAYEFQELAELAPLYAEPDTCEAVHDVIVVLNGLPFENAPDLGPEVDPENPHPVDSSIAGIDLVFDLVARDIRKLLGLKKLEYHYA